MNPGRLFSASLLVAVALAFVGCDDADPTGVTTYDITIVNQTAIDYEVWIDPDVDPAGFVRDGSVGANSTRTIPNRTIAVSYRIRLVLSGQNPETSFAHERTISSDGADVTWTVQP